MKPSLNFPILSDWTCVESSNSLNGVLYKENDVFYLKVKTNEAIILRENNSVGGLRWNTQLSSDYWLELLVREKSHRSSQTQEWIFLVDVILLTKGTPSKFECDEFRLKTVNVNILKKKLIESPKNKQPEDFKLLMTSSTEKDYFTFAIKRNQLINFVDFWYDFDHIQSLYFFHYSFSVEFEISHCKSGKNESEVIFTRYRPDPVSSHKQPIELEDLYNFTLSHFHSWNELRKNKVFVDVIFSLKTSVLDVERKRGLNKFMVLPIQQCYEGFANGLALDLKISREITKEHVDDIKSVIKSRSDELKLSEFATERLVNSLNNVRSGTARDKILAILNYIPKEKLIKNLKTTESQLAVAIDSFVKDFGKQRNYLNHYNEKDWELENIVDYFPLISVLFDFINTYIDNQVKKVNTEGDNL